MNGWLLDAMITSADNQVWIRPTLSAGEMDKETGSANAAAAPASLHEVSTKYNSTTSDGSSRNRPDLAVPENSEIAQSVMNFVTHSFHPVILADATKDPLFGRDVHIQRNGIRSLLCLPLMHRGGLTSVLYLDNRTSAGLFRRERLLICRLIAAQAAISIDNARLYKRVTQRTHELERATREAQEASRTKSTFLANMSHEIRTPSQSSLL